MALDTSLFDLAIADMDVDDGLFSIYMRTSSDVSMSFQISVRPLQFPISSLTPILTNLRSLRLRQKEP